MLLTIGARTVPMLVLQVAAHTMHFFYPRRMLHLCAILGTYVVRGDNSDIYQRAGRRNSCEPWVYYISFTNTERIHIYNITNKMAVSGYSNGLNKTGDILWRIISHSCHQVKCVTCASVLTIHNLYSDRNCYVI
jgi:hypothetical protein